MGSVREEQIPCCGRSGFHVYSGAESVDLGPRGRLAVRVFTIGAVIRVAVRATM